MKSPETVAELVRLQRADRAHRHRTELDFLPAALEILERPASFPARMTALAIVALVAIVIVWASLGRVDIVATADGKIVPDGDVKTIQPIEIGVVKHILVRNGQHVAAGQVLIELDPTSDTADLERITRDLLQVRLDIGRNEALLAGPTAPITAPPGADPKVMAEEVRSLAAEREQQTARLAALDRLLQARQRQVQPMQDLVKARRRKELQRLTAPVSGTVQQLAVHTVGGGVTAAEPLLVVVPDDSRLEVDVRVSNRDIGFVHAGQKAEIKVQTFDVTHYGVVHGSVLNVSRDALPPDKNAHQELVYDARVSLDRNSMDVDGHAISLGPGMMVRVEIKTGRRRLIDYLLSPVLRSRAEALQER